MKTCRSLSRCLFPLIFCLGPTVASAQLSFEEQRTIADRMSASLKYIAVDAVPSPLITTLPPKAVFWIRNNERRDYTFMFRKGDYTFGVNDPDGQSVGPYLCHAAKEFGYQEPRLGPRFLRNVKVDADIEAGTSGAQVGIGVDGLDAMIREMFAAVRYLGDVVLSREETRLYVLVRGHADAGPGFNRNLVPDHRFDTVQALPPNPQDPTGLHRYDPSVRAYPIPDPYLNDHLPELRARFLQKLIDSFAAHCVGAEFETRVLKGTATSGAVPSVRRVDIFLYAY